MIAFQLRRWIWPLLLLICLSPVLLASRCALDSNRMGWDSKALVKQLDDQETFVFFFGTDKCPACLKVKNKIYQDDEIQQAISDFKRKTDRKYAIYWYLSHFEQPNGVAYQKFIGELNEIFRKRKIKKIDFGVDPNSELAKEMAKDKFLQFYGSPNIIFWKNGQPTNQIFGGFSPVKETEFTTKFIKYLEVLTDS